MSVSGISPSLNEPKWSGLEGSGLQSDFDSDLEMMLGVLRQLPNVSVIDSPLIESDLTYPATIELEIEWQLELESPLLDFVSQLLDLLRRTTISQGMALDKKLAGRLDRIARHSSCVAESINTVRGSNETNDVSTV